MAKKYKIVFYAKTQNAEPNWTYQFTYRGDTISECVGKALGYANPSSISSFTILRGEAKKRNVKFKPFVNEAIEVTKLMLDKFGV